MPQVEPECITELPLRHLRARILYFQKLGSTNTFLKEYAQQPNLAEGVCVVAAEQIAGRGRLDHSWYSPANEGLYFSLLLKPQLTADHLPLLTLMAAIATAETVAAQCNRLPDIKWPNDILINKRKIAGILTEAKFENLNLNFAVIGIGINLNQRFFPNDIDQRATSIYLEKRSSVDRDLIIKELLSRIDHWYSVLKHAPAGIVERWQHLSSYAHGKLIRVELDQESITARTCGLANNGALRAQLADGQIITLMGSEVTAAEEEV